jgi:hypothetical protein
VTRIGIGVAGTAAAREIEMAIMRRDDMMIEMEGTDAGTSQKEETDEVRLYS